ncbi:MAG TPA: cob(I)yrinic acid a,c-diamide adenosyltransferase [Ruminococcaceae bacterium]|jgi:cob(I)alamin adenosyltransferase|nr:cob(I)yrinic acid a,c-diamide adenosyltransferase [Oscillospiraceae bacterium]
MERGLVHLYYGDGKGKTTAAAGLGLRAWGRGKTVLMVQFLKGFDSGEILALGRLGGRCRLFPGTPVKKFTGSMSARERERTALEQRRMFFGAAEQCLSGLCDVAVFDELVDAVNLGAVSVPEVADFIRSPARMCEVVITGHRPDPAFFEFCDYITEMKKIRHPFDRGIRARDGIEK